MIEPSGYRVRCDQETGDGSRCPAGFEADSLFGARGIYATAEQENWQVNVKQDGQPASRGGKDYCPIHRRGCAS